MARCPTLNSSPFDAIKPNEKILNVVADRAGNYWFRLLSNLGVPKSTIDSFKSDNATVRDACFVGLVFWLTGGVKDSEEPVLFITLFKALRESMMTDCVSVLEEKLEKKHSEEDRSTQTKQIAEVVKEMSLMKEQQSKTTEQQSKMTEQLDLVCKSLHVLRKEHDQRPSEIAEVVKEMSLMKEQQSKNTKQLDLAGKSLHALQKELDQRSSEDTSGRTVMVPPVWLDQSESPPTAHSQRIPPIEQLNIAPLFSPRVQLLNSPNLVKACKQIEMGPSAVFKLVPKHWKENEKHKIASCIVGEETSYTIHSLHKVIMVVGATGSGKSTIINALANYMLGVTFSDPHRYQLIRHSQAHSQTSWVKAYTFPKQLGSRIPYALTIVDTPGYGDNRGVDHDINFTEQIRFFLESKEIGVDHINAIAFVVKASDARLTKAQNYLFKSILALFAKDTAPGMMVVATHADGKDIKAKQTLKDAGVPVQDEFTFAVNNSALYAPSVTGDEPDDDFVLQNKITWNRNDKVFRTMYDAVGQMPSISLSQTKENWKERDNFLLILESIGPQIQEGIDNVRSIVKLSEVIKRCQKEIDENEDFAITATVLVAKTELVELDSTFALNCTTCKMTCHHPCTAVFNRTCDVMAFLENKCSVCPKQCNAAKHEREKYQFKAKLVKEKQVLTKAQLKKHEFAEVDMRSRSKAALNALLQKQAIILIQNLVLIRKAKHCLRRIQEISLNPTPTLREEDYIDTMIKNEQAEMKEGWEERVQFLNQLKHFAKLTSHWQIDKLEEKDHAALLKALHMDRL